MEATEWKFLPSELLEQDMMLMDNIFSIKVALERAKHPG
jgi:hypothetical protein